MALRINHNIAALNALRNLDKTDARLSDSLEKLSSGLSVNRAADGPATLVISEQMRGQIASINQAIQNSEASISMVQTAEAALNEVNRLLVSMRELAIHAANEGANDERMLAADQAEIENALDTIDRIARSSQFGTRTLLDGSNGANGVAVGEGLEFVAASADTRSSPAQGYKVDVAQAATRATKRGQRPITLQDLVRGFQLLISEGGKNVTFDSQNPEDARDINKMLSQLQSEEGPDARQALRDAREMVAQRLRQKADNAGLNVDIFVDTTQGPDGPLVVRHREYGSEPTFHVSSSVPGILGTESNKFEEAVRGHDVEGTIEGKLAVGHGETLTAPENTDVQGLRVKFSSRRLEQIRVPRFVEDENGRQMPNPRVDQLDAQFEAARRAPDDQRQAISRQEQGEAVVYTFSVPARVASDIEGYVHVSQNSLAFQVGPTRGQQVKISLLDAKSSRLSSGIENDSGFRSLREIDVTTSQGAQDALLLVDEAINEVSSLRADLGAFQKNTLESNANSLRIAEENLTSAESSLRDADMAKEMSDFTRNQIMFASGMAMLAQANQTPKTVLQLLGTQQR